MAACTSRAAPSMFAAQVELQRDACPPSELDEVISVMPAMWPSCRSSGVATEAAMICALAPGRLALTLMVGKSTCGSGATGSTINPIAPAIATAMVSSVVPTGRRMNAQEKLTNASPQAWASRFRRVPQLSPTDGSPEIRWAMRSKKM